jgi:hypothetical protein
MWAISLVALYGTVSICWMTHDLIFCSPKAFQAVKHEYQGMKSAKELMSKTKKDQEASLVSMVVILLV